MTAIVSNGCYLIADHPSVNPDPEYVKKVSREVWDKFNFEIHNHPKF